MVPARGGFSIVLNPGERSIVCPEGRDAQTAFWKMVSRGLIQEMGARAARYGRGALAGRTSGHPQAA
jgi:hypothetical protein